MYSDTLRRHKKIHLKLDEVSAPRVSRACDRCHFQKSKCDGANPCGICARKGLECSFTRDGEPKNNRMPPVENHYSITLRDDGNQPARKRTRRYELVQEDEELDPTSLARPGPSCSFLSTAPEQEIRAELQKRESKLQEDAVKSAEQHPHHLSNPTFRLGDLFVPSAEDENQLPGDEDVIDSFARAIDVDYYVCLYFVHFHPFWPFIMKTSFTPRTEPRILVLATVMIGLWVTGEDRLRKVAWTIHDHLHVMLKRQMVSSSWKTKKGLFLDQPPY